VSRRGVWTSVVVVLILAGGAVAVDLLARDRVEARIAEEVASSFETGSRPEVEISGTAFLPQVIGGKVDRVRVSADAAKVGELPMEDVVLELSGVSPSEPYRADRVDFEGLVPLASAQGVAPEGIELRLEESAVVMVTEVLGLELQAAARPIADGRAVVAQVETLSLAGVTVEVADLPAAVAEALSEVRIPIDGLPEGMELSSVTVVDAGFAVSARGENLAVTG